MLLFLDILQEIKPFGGEGLGGGGVLKKLKN